MPPAARGRFLKKLPPWTPGKNFLLKKKLKKKVDKFELMY